MNNDLTLPPVFQHWQVAPLEAGGDVSFELAETPSEQVSLWSLDLPADPGEAATQLDEIEAQLQAAQAALESAPERLEGFVDRLESAPQEAYALEAYPAGATGPQPAEAALLRWLEATRPGEVSFEVAGGREAEMTTAIDQFQEAVSALIGQILHLAKVETRLGGQIVAHSLVSWKGDTDTSWIERLPPEQRSLHQRSLALALASRLAMLKMFVTAAQGATRIAALIAAPGGVLLALPAAWKYLNTLLSQVQEMRS